MKTCTTEISVVFSRNKKSLLDLTNKIRELLIKSNKYKNEIKSKGLYRIILSLIESNDK